MVKLTKHIFRRYTLLLLGLMALLLSFVWEPVFVSKTDQKSEGERISGVFESKEKLIRSEIDHIAMLLADGKGIKDLWQNSPGEEKGKQGLYYTVSAYDTLVYWSSSLVAFETKREQIGQEGVLRKMPTGWFYLFSRQQNEFSIKGYMLIKRDFPYQNRYVQSAFQEDFGLSNPYEVVSEEQPGSIQVFCDEGKFHFGIQYKNRQNGNSGESIPALLFFLFFVGLISSHFLKVLSGWNVNPWMRFLLTLAFASLFYLLLNLFKLPEGVYAGKLFAPTHFARGRLLSSLGDYLLLSFFLFFLAHSLFSYFRKSKYSGALSFQGLSLYVIGSLYFIVSTLLFLTLLENSDINLELYNNFSPSVQNILATSAIAIQMIGLGVIMIRIRCAEKRGNKYFAFFFQVLFSLVLLLLLLRLAGITLPFVAILSYLFIAFLLDRSEPGLLSRYKLTSLFVFGLLSAFGMNLVAQMIIERRKADIQQVMAVNMAAERDPAAEIFLSDFEAKISKDTMIQSFLAPPYVMLENYLKNVYFTGFWKNYEFRLTVCAAKDSLYLSDVRQRFPCLDFFNNLKVSKGVLLPGSDFYFMDRLNGRISYLGELHLDGPKDKRPLMAFIELNSKIVPEGKGYPQLLLDQQAARRNRNEGFSYAKYFDNRLVDRGGNFMYDPNIPPDLHFSNEFAYFEKGGFYHCVYRRGGENYVIVSYPIPTGIERWRGFPPLFLFVYLFGFFWILLAQGMKLLSKDRLELRGKIQFTMVATLLALFFIIGVGFIRYNFLEFQRSLKDNLDQKVRAISAELGLRIGNTVRLDSIHTFLGDQLLEISDITWTDINIFDLKGVVVASSRYEIFSQGLTSNRMNPVAYATLRFQNGSTFLHNENLGKMEFFSVYAPLYNGTNELVGYVNLPYFNRQDEFTSQVSGFIVAFMNLYILLILLTMIIALIISNKLTVPLLLIEQKLKGIALGKQNATIEYRGEDEIGRLVEAYNRKVADLAESARLLARSERELAWKEMARQIAHEINNPLTPMKLNVQHLQKIKNMGSPQFDEYFNRVTGMLIGQIDALSSIASAFSDFARMPAIRMEPVDMVGLVREIATLFDTPEQFSLRVNCPERQILVLGDHDQLRRAMVNIVRNATQAVHNQTDGYILITIEESEGRVRIVVQDNGPGIPETVHPRLFEPNFTTKSGGMGLGLAITKSIVETYLGEISFQSKPGETLFYLDFPRI